MRQTKPKPARARKHETTEPEAAFSGAESDLAKRDIREIVRDERRLRENCSWMERIIHRATRFSGSVPFVVLHAVSFVVWIFLNTVLPASSRWDPYPYTFLTLVVSLEAIFLSTFILVTENREAAVAERRMHLDLEINMLAEREDTRTLVLLYRIAEKLGVPFSKDAETQALEEKTEPSRILKLIDQCLKENGSATGAPPKS